ncbi:MAG TPA: glycoside hydrolase family 95 protein [Opitutaceae bacterium]
MSSPARLIVAAALLSLPTTRAAETVVRLDAPAKHFTESTPLGNGRLGAMLFGGIDEERIILNESGMWSGSPQDADRPDAAAVLPEIRRLLLAGRNVEAEALVSANFTCAGSGSGHANGANVPYGSYQLLGNLHLRFQYPDTYAAGGDTLSDYSRELDLADAVGRLSYTRRGVRYSREAFVSAPGEVFVLRLAADRAGALSFDLSLDRPERFTIETAGADGLRMAGQLNDGRNGAEGVRYAARLRVIPTGGSVELEGTTVRVRGAREALVLVTAATDIKTFAGRGVTDALATADADLARVEKQSFDELRYLHVADHRRYFDRTRIRLGAPNKAADPRPAPARLASFAAGGHDPGLAELYFNFGRYLLISSSRPGGLPANLQGLWADSVQTPWNGDWHLNVNVQMNYWPAEVAGLGELHTPLFALIGSLVEPGARTARKYYASRGWVAHVLSNPWGFTSPGEGASWGSSTTGSAWLSLHLWEHYRYGGDRTFLEKAYPILKGSAQFYSDMLIAEPAHGWLVTAPSNSPENAFVLPDGGRASVCYGATYDQQLIRALFTACIDAAETLGVDADFRQTLTRQRARLAPTRIAADGRVMEWQQEYQETDPHHRHISHLWGLFPGNEITPAGTPELAAAARKTLEARGDGGTGWCIAHKLGLWARLGDGDRAHALLRSLLKPSAVSDQITVHGGGSYSNLFCSHPPFQIDGNFGGAAGIAELLLQSHAGEIHLLPALPSIWPEGEARGLRARGGFAADFAWREGRVVAAALHGRAGATARVRIGSQVTSITIPAGGSSVVARGDSRAGEDAATIATAAKPLPKLPTL